MIYQGLAAVSWSENKLGLPVMVLTLFVSISNDLLNDVIWLKPMWDIPMDQHGEKLKHQDDCLIC
jgi:hypothetical protein